ncbi:serine--tRNA ligase [Candidatus Aerophobetes bacterium]|uniref:Serine--tRNA ligase n=1 Tax=Aerophobetes bacterium TaxID=2030807 RepID=A0A2A4X3A5_UNCAE|nr:MAG: serine--tRNA ligase [Candidatus Aerophobetes bacterium]
MLDIKIIRNSPETIEKKLQSKDPKVSLKNLLDLDKQIKALKAELEQLQHARNSAAKAVGEAKRKGENATSLLKENSHLQEKLQTTNASLNALLGTYQNALLSLPNIPADDVKPSLDVAENEQIKVYKEQPSFSFAPKNHMELNEKLHLFDFERGAKITGSLWPTYRGMGARLEWALIQLMIDTHINAGFEFWLMPLAANKETMQAAGNLPKFEDQLFKLDEEAKSLYLIPTSEAALNSLYRDEIIPEKNLPIKMCCYSPCFRREAGAAGSGERGLIRTHQFNKVEMFAICKPDQSETIMTQLRAQAELVLEKLDLHYRVMHLVSGDTSFQAAKTLDIEVYLPGQKRYYEVSSISNCTDFQSRRSKIRSKKGNDKPLWVHTLNGSGLATSRLMVALLETNQNEDGSVTIPEALRPYMQGESKIEPK